MSRGQFAAQVREGKGGEFAAQANEVTRLGKTTFGQDQSADQINDLLDKAMGGLANVTPDKASDFLAKVQSTARALDINSKAFAEYLAAQQKVYKDMGVGGSIGAEATMGAALTARGVSERARENGDAVLGDQNRAMAAGAANAQASQGSQLVKQLRFVAAQAQGMDDAESKENGVGGQGLKENVRQVGELLRAGKGKEAEALFSKIRNESRLGADTIVEGGRNLSEEDAEASKPLVGAVTGRDSDADVRAKVTRRAYQVASQERGFDRSAISQETYEKAVEGLTAAEMTKPEKVEAALVAQGVAPEAARAARQPLKQGADVAISNTAAFYGYGRRTQAQVRYSLDQSRPNAEAENETVRAAQRGDEAKVRPLNAENGKNTLGVNLPEIFGQGINQLTQEVQKGGKWDIDRSTNFLKDFVKKAMQADPASPETGSTPSLIQSDEPMGILKSTSIKGSPNASGSEPNVSASKQNEGGEAIAKEQLDTQKSLVRKMEEVHMTLKQKLSGTNMPIANAPSNTGL